MLNPKTNERELAYIVRVDEVKELPGYDRIAHYRVNGWWCVAGKNDFKVGDLALYIEIDSLCPYTKYFTFLDEAFSEDGKKRPDRHKIKTQKFCKGTAISQGLLCPLKDFDLLSNAKLGDFATKILGITYYEAEDNVRKANNSKYTSMQARHKKFFKSKLGKWLMKRNWGRKLCFFFLGKKKDKKTDWPNWVVKTDEERIQNCFEHRKSIETTWYATEKIDGSSATFTMKQDKPKKRKLIVCSRNVVFDKPEKEDKNFYKDTDGNIYLEMADKYNIEQVCQNILDKNPSFEFITIQGEVYGGNIQKRDYGKEHRLAIFNVIFKENGQAPRRLNPLEMKTFLDNYPYKVMENEYSMHDIYCLPTVPYIGTYTMPETCDEVVAFAAGESKIDKGIREGVVFRSLDGVHSFKAVDPEFLIKYHNG